MDNPTSASAAREIARHLAWELLPTGTVHTENAIRTLTRALDDFAAEQTRQLREEHDAELSRALQTIAGWFGCADEANGKTADELGRFLYKRQGEIRDSVVKICREGWQQRAQAAEAERDKLRKEAK